MTIEDQVKEIISNHLDVSTEALKADANFINDLGADSLDNVEIVLALEETFKISIPDDQAENILTVGQAVKYVTHRLGAPA